MHICADQFKTYHDWEDNESSHSSTTDDEIGETDQVKKVILFTTISYRKPRSKLMNL